MLSLELFDYLALRRTIPAAQLVEPGPDPETIQNILKIAARVPDHGKLAPWRFIIYGREERRIAADWLIARAKEVGGPDNTEKFAERARRFAEAPLVIAVISCASDHPKIPQWEQILSAGAVCLNLIHASNASGYSAQWLTDWFAYDKEANAFLGVMNTERVAGFIYIGKPAAPPTERDRPDISEKTTHWQAREKK